MTASVMTSAARTLLGALSATERDAALHTFDDPVRTRWSYLPQSRPGVGLLGLGKAARKAAHRLLATALSPAAFAQAVTIMAFEEVLDLRERGRMGRHSDDYWIAVFGEPGESGGAPWSWRFEGHHLSVTATVAGDQVIVAPLFLGANPARVTDRDGRLVVGPLHREEDLARAVLAELPPALRAQAIVAEVAPSDILTSTAERVDGALMPPGVRAADLSGTSRELLESLLRSYLFRLTPALAEAEHKQAQLDELTFAWAGGRRPGEGHYYRLQLPGLLIEYDNTQTGANHAHTVLRRPGSDFGADILQSHLSTER